MGAFDFAVVAASCAADAIGVAPIANGRILLAPQFPFCAGNTSRSALSHPIGPLARRLASASLFAGGLGLGKPWREIFLPRVLFGELQVGWGSTDRAHIRAVPKCLDL